MNRQYGIFRAIVVSVDDPMQLDRIRVRVPEVLGGTITDWVWPKHVAPNWSWKPNVDERVWVEFENGDIDRPLYSGTWYPRVGNESSIPEEVTDNYLRVRMIQTPEGHKIIFTDPDPSDATVANGITVKTKEGHVIDLADASNGKQTSIKTAGNHEIRLDDQNSKISILHSDNNTKIELDASGNITISAKSGSKVQLQGAAVLPLAGVVTTNHTCAFTGGPHPQGSADVEASG